MRLYLTEVKPKDLCHGHPVSSSNDVLVTQGKSTYIYGESSTLAVSSSGLSRMIYRDGGIQEIGVGGWKGLLDLGEITNSPGELQIPVPSTEVDIIWRQYKLPSASTRFVTEFLDDECIDCYFDSNGSSPDSLTNDAATLLEHLKFC